MGATPRVLVGRDRERAALDEVLTAVRDGGGRALVLRGEAGIGKSALLDYVAEQATDCTLVRAAGVQSEMELPFAGLHQLCAPLLDRLERLPEPQRDALSTAFGMRAGEAPGRFVIGLAVLTLLAEAADEKPLVCLVDDVQWLDRASAQTLAFVARRLQAEPVALILAARDEPELEGLPELTLAGLDTRAARELLRATLRVPLDERVRDQFVRETHGNPLALLELPLGPTAELAGGFGVPGALPLTGRIEASFLRRLEPLPAATRRLLLVAAAEPAGDPLLLSRAAALLDIGLAAAEPAEAAGLLELDVRVRFHHPLLRSAVYRSASPAERREVHRALAEATDPETDPDRLAWHRAHAAEGPDDAVADELERSAGRAQARGGVAAAAAFLERAAELTRDPWRRAERGLAATDAKYRAGAPEAARQLLAGVEAGPLSELQRARADLLRAQILALSHGAEAPGPLLAAARRLNLLDSERARDTYLDALSAALFAGPLAVGTGLQETARAACGAPSDSGARDLLLHGIARLMTQGHDSAAPSLKQALRAFRDETMSRDEALRWMFLATIAAMDLWDDESWHLLSIRYTQLARDAGALAILPLALSSRAGILANMGEFAACQAVVDEIESVTAAAGVQLAPYGGLGLIAWRGTEEEAEAMMTTTMREAVPRGEGIALSAVGWTRTFVHNRAGRHAEAVAAAEQALRYPAGIMYARWVLIELVEAAVAAGMRERAAAALERLTETTRAAGTEWGLGLEARSRALLSHGDAAERLFREAIDRLSRTRIRAELARTHLLYGEWLARERGRGAGREQLHVAHGLFTAMGAEAFAERALGTRRGARRSEDGGLTTQEARIARLARDGLSNAEIGARLYISPRTVEYHLSKVFGKLDISSRTELDRLPATLTMQP